MRSRRIAVNVYDIPTRSFRRALLETDGASVSLSPGDRDSGLYLGPGWIDMHVHVYVGGGPLGVSPERGGLRRGVHLVVDAGSAGAFNLGALRDCVATSAATRVKAFLNISAIGLASAQPYHDLRLVDAAQTARCIREDGGKFLVGVKVLASRVRVEEAGLEPLKRALEAADMAGCRLMAHLAEGPPYNEQTMPLLRRGDIISHCFHGDKYRTGRSNLMWKADGTPAPPLDDALRRGVVLDVGHGGASLSAQVARSVVQAGRLDFIISTDLHSGNVDGPVYGLAETMSKFLSFGMPLGEVVHAVTRRPAETLGLQGWGEQLCREATIFRLRNSCDTDPPLLDALGRLIPAQERIEPVAVVVAGRLRALAAGWWRSG